MTRLAALACGLLCGIGLIASGLFQPSLLRGFLNPVAAWDPTLGLGLLSALGVAVIIFTATQHLSNPVLGGEKEPITDGQVWKVVVGGVLFGVGWGLAGYYPLAALVSLGLFAPGAAIFLASVLGGVFLHDFLSPTEDS